jgi:hypothetical protein
MKKIIIYRNPQFEEKTKEDLQTAKAAMQTVLDEWLNLGLGPCMGLNDLVLSPRAVYDKAINAAIKVPELSGPFKMKTAQYRDQLVLPDPSALYDACKQALRLPYTAMYGVFIVNDNVVELDQDGANDLINSQTLYGTPKQGERIKKLQALIPIINEINIMLNGDLLRPCPATNQFFRGRFTLKEIYINGVYTYELADIDMNYLKELVR